MATIYVTTALDIVNAGDGKTSLREAVIQANTNGTTSDVIRFDQILAGQRGHARQRGKRSTSR